MTKIWFSQCLNSDGSPGWKTTNYAHKGSIAIDSSQQVFELCPIHKKNMIHLKEIKGIRAIFMCCKCYEEAGKPTLATMNQKGEYKLIS